LRNVTQTEAMSSAVLPEACIYRRMIIAPMALNWMPVGNSHSPGMPFLDSIVIISLRSAEPQRSHCSTSTLCACPVAINPCAARTALSLVEPPEWTI